MDISPKGRSKVTTVRESSEAENDPFNGKPIGTLNYADANANYESDYALSSIPYIPSQATPPDCLQ